ncbi:DUF2613 domain-containing protein [Nocardia camponoti]|uniref:DUF2613 domain-containing protein n=1 Tax=Nocardia camponoti TaxID=1616106 RepID=UPI00166486D8|nr:DUF2613 domain-containing protein [Nocardia camponoti]
MKFAVPAVASGVAGVILGVLAVVGITFAAQENSIPAPETTGDPGTSLLGDVQYGSR